MKQILVSDETHSLAKAEAAKFGVPLFRWIEKLIQSVCGMPSVDIGSVHEMSMEDRLAASVKQAESRKEKP